MRHRGRKFYLDKQNGKISGVCAGLADYFGWDVTIVRIIWVVATICTGFWPMIVAYIVAAWMVDAKPGDYDYADMRTSVDEARRDAYRHDGTRERAWRFTDVKDRFTRVEDRLRTLEQVVTSREFQMDRELRGTGRA